MSDDDLIRRGDALYAIAGWEIPSTAIAALPPAKQEHVADSNARGVGVKPLVWQFEQEDVQVANTSARHQYRVIHDRRATNGAWSWFCDGAWIGCETEEAAKAAAQADYEARIFAALAPTDAAQAEDSYPYDGPEQCERDLEDTAAQESKNDR